MLPFLKDAPSAASAPRRRRSHARRMRTVRRPVAPEPVSLPDRTQFPHAQLDPEVEEFLQELHRSLAVKERGILDDRPARRMKPLPAAQRAHDLRQRLSALRARRKQAREEALRHRAEAAPVPEDRLADPSPALVTPERAATETMETADAALQAPLPAEEPVPVQPEAEPSPQTWQSLFPDSAAEPSVSPAAEPVMDAAAAGPVKKKRGSFLRSLFRRRSRPETPPSAEDVSTGDAPAMDALTEATMPAPAAPVTPEPQVEEQAPPQAQANVGSFLRRLFRRRTATPAAEAQPEAGNDVVRILEMPVESTPGAKPEPIPARRLNAGRRRSRPRPSAAPVVDVAALAPAEADSPAGPAQEGSEPPVQTEPAVPAESRPSLLSRFFRRRSTAAPVTESPEQVSAAGQAENLFPAQSPFQAPPRRSIGASIRNTWRGFRARLGRRRTPPSAGELGSPPAPSGAGRILGPHETPLPAAPAVPSADGAEAPAPARRGRATNTEEPEAPTVAPEGGKKSGRMLSALDRAEKDTAAGDAVAEAAKDAVTVKAPHIKRDGEPAKEEPVVVVEAPKTDQRVKHSMDRLKSRSGGFQDFLGAVKYLGLGKERTAIVQNLATMMNAGLPLIDALHTLKKESTHKPIRKMLQSVIDLVESGSALWRAMEAQHFFSPHAISLIRIGEEAGNLAENLERLAVQQEKDAALRGKIKMAMIYPTIVITLMFIIVMGLGIFVLPQLIGVLKSLGGDLPLVTRLVMMFSDFMSQNAVAVVAGSLGGVFTIIVLAKFTRMKVVFQWISFRIPGIGALAKQATIARFGIILGSLLEAGVPLIEALNSLAEVTTTVAYRKFYVRLAEHVNLGDSFSKSFEAIRGSNKLLPVTVQQLIMTGERSGSLAKVLIKVSEIYEKKANETAEKLPVILEPMILLMIGALVGTIAFAIIIPIYSVVGNVGKA